MKYFIFFSALCILALALACDNGAPVQPRLAPQPQPGVTFRGIISDLQNGNRNFRLNLPSGNPLAVEVGPGTIITNEEDGAALKRSDLQEGQDVSVTGRFAGEDENLLQAESIVIHSTPDDGSGGDGDDGGDEEGGKEDDDDESGDEDDD